MLFFVCYLEIREIIRTYHTYVSSCRTLKIVTLCGLQALHSADIHATKKACGCCADTYFPALFGAARSCGGGFADLYHMGCPFMPVSCKKCICRIFCSFRAFSSRESGENDGKIPKILEKLQSQISSKIFFPSPRIFYRRGRCSGCRSSSLFLSSRE